MIPLGGVGEFGANATIVQTDTTTVLVDYGLMFPPDNRQPGVDYYINDPAYVLRHFPDLSALFVTHGHEDHIGGISFLLKARQMPIYTMPYTANLIKMACDGVVAKAEIHRVDLDTPVRHGDIEVTFIGVTHSIAQACALHLQTPSGSILHSGDFKVDPLPSDDYPFQSERLRAIGDAGLDLLIMDSTNATKGGFCPSDRSIVPSMDALIDTAPGRVFVTTFSSHLPRLQHVIPIARRTNRQIALVGRGFHRHYRNAIETKYMPYGGDIFVDMQTAQRRPDDRIIYVATGSQAEHQSALARISRDMFKDLKFKAGDRVIFSSKAIPGNERQLALFISQMERHGVDVYTDRTHEVHTSGHGYREDQAYLMTLTQPRAVAPIHGEYHQLLKHFQWLRALAKDEQDVLLIEDGDVILIKDAPPRVDGSIPVQMIPIDGNQYIPVPYGVLKERKDMMYSGMLLVVAEVRSGRGHYEVETHGMVESEPGDIATHIKRELGRLHFDAGTQAPDWADSLYRQTKRALKRVFFGRPLIKVVVNGQIFR